MDFENHYRVLEEVGRVRWSFVSSNTEPGGVSGLTAEVSLKRDRKSDIICLWSEMFQDHSSNCFRLYSLVPEQPAALKSRPSRANIVPLRSIVAVRPGTSVFPFHSISHLWNGSSCVLSVGEPPLAVENGYSCWKIVESDNAVAAVVVSILLHTQMHKAHAMYWVDFFCQDQNDMAAKSQSLVYKKMSDVYGNCKECVLVTPNSHRLAPTNLKKLLEKTSLGKVFPVGNSDSGHYGKLVAKNLRESEVDLLELKLSAGFNRKLFSYDSFKILHDCIEELLPTGMSESAWEFAGPLPTRAMEWIARAAIIMNKTFAGLYFRRVWTFQEVVLPRTIMICFESGFGYSQDLELEIIDLDVLMSMFFTMVEAHKVVLKICFVENQIGTAASAYQAALNQLTVRVRSTTEWLISARSLLQGRNSENKKVNLSEDAGYIESVIQLYSAVPRKCSFELDIVYGILGLFAQLEIEYNPQFPAGGFGGLVSAFLRSIMKVTKRAWTLGDQNYNSSISWLGFPSGKIIDSSIFSGLRCLGPLLLYPPQSIGGDQIYATCLRGSEAVIHYPGEKMKILSHHHPDQKFATFGYSLCQYHGGPASKTHGASQVQCQQGNGSHLVQFIAALMCGCGRHFAKMHEAVAFFLNTEYWIADSEVDSKRLNFLTTPVSNRGILGQQAERAMRLLKERGSNTNDWTVLLAGQSSFFYNPSELADTLALSSITNNYQVQIFRNPCGCSYDMPDTFFRFLDAWWFNDPENLPKQISPASFHLNVALLNSGQEFLHLTPVTLAVPISSAVIQLEFRQVMREVAFTPKAAKSEMQVMNDISSKGLTEGLLTTAIRNVAHQGALTLKDQVLMGGWVVNVAPLAVEPPAMANLAKNYVICPIYHNEYLLCSDISAAKQGRTTSRFILGKHEGDADRIKWNQYYIF
ncbi:hypothetical protein HK096_002244 [Nowakowskiella sp. JEL0078]|nr:hypothetical protein HK096_002244 [Nowakowskiella sp. JEL0078]